MWRGEGGEDEGFDRVWGMVLGKVEGVGLDWEMEKGRMEGGIGRRIGGGEEGEIYKVTERGGIIC